MAVTYTNKRIQITLPGKEAEAIRRIAKLRRTTVSKLFRKAIEPELVSELSQKERKRLVSELYGSCEGMNFNISDEHRLEIQLETVR